MSPQSLVTLALAVVACATASQARAAEGSSAPVAVGRSREIASIDPPAASGSTHPTLASEAVTTLRQEHDVLMTWLEPGGSLRFARFVGEDWSQPITIVRQVSALATDRATLTVLDTQAVRRTLIARTGDTVARSGDAGRTWTRLPAPVLPFASFAGGDEGGYAFWLDIDADGSARLLGTRILAGQTVLDERVSAGSSTSAAMTWDGPVVVYRDGGTGDAHDIAVVRRQDAQWTRPRPVHHVVGWRPDRTFESGPELAALERRVAVAWATEAPHRPRVLVAFSADAGRTFGPPVEVAVKEGADAPLPVVDVDLDDNGDALVLWTAITGPGEAALQLARVSADGRRGEAIIVAAGLPTGTPGNPQIIRAGDRAAVVWVDAEYVRVVAVPIAAIPTPGTGRRTGPAVAGKTSTAPGGRARLSDTVVDLELESLRGENVSLASLRGRAALLNLWAIWCLPCIAEMPELVEIHERYGPEGLVVVGLNVDDAAATDKVRSFVAERELPFPIWLDPEMRVYGELRVKSLPVTLVVDPEGGIVWRRDGTITVDDPELEQALRVARSDL